MKDKLMIGLEIHGYLDTNEKLFCRCKNFHDMKLIKPNTNICPICTAQPGSKPMLPNNEAIKKILEIALMLNCIPNIIESDKPFAFQRKHYNWPDMPTGYQKTISGAHSIPVAEDGKFLDIRITEVHLEEDPAAWNPDTGKIDYNRAGVPLVEIVTEPDFKTKEQVEHWLKQLVLTLSYIKALNKDAGIKADVNINIKGVSIRTEIKNVNSITEIIKAIDSEFNRHQKEKPNTKETRRWNSEKKRTELMRSKEDAQDYRFIPDPDLPMIKITNSTIKKIKQNLPESPMQKLEKVIKIHKLKPEDAEILTKNLDIVELFEKVVEEIPSNIALPWITVEWLSVLNYNKKSSDEVKLNPDHLIELLKLLKENKITPLKAKEILRRFIPESYSPLEEAKSSEIISSDSEIKNIVKQIIKDNPKSVADFKNGESKALNFLIGQIMHKTNKRADFATAKKILENELK